MSKVEALGTLASLENQTSAIQVLNENVEKIEDAFDNTLSRDGSGPNAMEAPLDMNGQRILNLPVPAADNDPVRLIDLTEASIFADDVVLPTQTGNANKVLSTTGFALVWSTPASLPGVGDLKAANNLSEVDAGTARSNLGLNGAAIKPVGTSGDAVPLLNASATWSDVQTWEATNVLSGDIVVNGTVTSPRSVGFRGSPLSTKTADYPLAASNAGETLFYNEATAKTVTLTKDVIPVGQFVSVLTTGVGVINIVRAAGVSLAKLGTGGNANIVLSQWGLATLYHYAANQWIVWGTNIA